MVPKSFTKVSDYGFFGTVSKTLFFHLIQVSCVSLSLFFIFIVMLLLSVKT